MLVDEQGAKREAARQRVAISMHFHRPPHIYRQLLSASHVLHHLYIYADVGGAGQYDSENRARAAAANKTNCVCETRKATPVVEATYYYVVHHGHG
jgi:hypothetical protein